MQGNCKLGVQRIEIIVGKYPPSILFSDVKFNEVACASLYNTEEKMVRMNVRNCASLVSFPKKDRLSK